VTTFDPEKIPEECFGGVDPGAKSSRQVTTQRQTVFTSRSFEPHSKVNFSKIVQKRELSDLIQTSIFG